MIKPNTCILLFLLLAIGFSSLAQTDTLDKPEKPSKINLLVYGRVISNAKGAVRTDQNLVGNFKITSWLRLEAGIRTGERPSAFNAYYHYKFELQSKWFYHLVRVFARISDNVIDYPKPSYRKTNEIFAAEVKYPLSKSFQLFAAGGYVFSTQQNNKPDALPTSRGLKNNYPIYKIALRYKCKKTETELAYGSYDVFNPYLYNQPFSQITVAYKVHKICTLQSYFRYQYNHSFVTPNNYFFSLGAVFHIR